MNEFVDAGSGNGDEVSSKMGAIENHGSSRGKQKEIVLLL